MKVSALTPGRLAIAIIAIPLLLTGIYYLGFAADRYTSESIVAVRDASTGAESGGGGGLTSFAAPAAREDTVYLLDFIHSQDLMLRLNKELKLREHYEQPNSDFFFRLRPGTSQEWFLDYYRSRVEVEFDDISGLLHIRSQGFDRELAVKLNKAILDACQRFVNDFSHRVAGEAMRFNETEVQRASAKLEAAKTKVATFQAKNRLLDPVAVSAAATSLTSELQGTLARQEADLKNMLSYMQDNAPAVQAQRNQVAATRSQLESEKLRATSPTSGDRLGELNIEYQRLLLQATLAEDSYKSAAAALDAARIDSSRMLKSLIVVEPPSTPETAMYPTRAFNLLTLLVICALLYVIVRLIVVTIQEHQD